MRPRHLLTALLAFVCTLILAPTVAAQNDRRTITLLSTTDIHTNLVAYDYYASRPAEWGLAKVATLVNQERAKDPSALLLDSGDTIQGTPLGYYYAVVDPSAPHPMAVAMNALKYDVAALGNHEFNYGLDTLNRWISQCNFPVLSANIRKGDGSEAFKPYVIKDVNGVQVGILGMTTPAIPNWEKPANIEGLRFDDPVATAQRYVPQMRAEGADVVVVMQHIGWEKLPPSTSDPSTWLSDPSTWQDSGSLPRENTTIELAQQVPGIDVILAGHSHLDVPKSVINGVLILEASYWGRVLGKVTVEVQGGGNTWQVVAKDSTTLKVNGVEADPTLQSLAAPYFGRTLEYISTPVGTALGEFAGGPRARYLDGPLADLINTVQTEAAAAAGFPVDISLAAIFTDPGHIPQGQIALRDVYSTYIYDNTLYAMEINGDILRRALEKDAEYFLQLDPAALPEDPKGVVAPNARDYNWDIYSGVDYTIDLTRPAGQRVTRLQYKGQDVRPDQTFRIAINNYRASGGGGFGMFREGKIIWQSTSEVRDLLAEYVRARGTIDPQALNVRNFTLVPDLYGRYFGAAPPASDAPATTPPAAPAQPPAGGAPTTPATLPNTSGPADQLWLLALSALVALGGGALVRRKATLR